MNRRRWLQPSWVEAVLIVLILTLIVVKATSFQERSAVPTLDEHKNQDPFLYDGAE